MKRIAILMLMSIAALAQDNTQTQAQQTTSATTQTKPATPAKKSSSTAQKSGTATSSTGQKSGASTSGAANTGAAKASASGTAKKPGTTSAKAGSSKTGTKTTAAKTAAKTGAKPVDPNADRPTPEEVSAMTPNPEALFDTSMGKMRCELFAKQAPKTVANFIGLAQGTKHWTDPKTGKKLQKPLFDGTIFHRVIPNFMIQGGDPLGNGTGDPGYRFEDEFTPELRFDRPGRLAMANSGPGTNGSQFFITEVPTPHLDDHHTIFGQCDDASVDLVKKIARVATDGRNNRPDLDVTINHLEILGGPKKPAMAKKPTVTKRVIPKKTVPTPPKS